LAVNDRFMILQKRIPKYAAGSATAHAGRNYSYKTADTAAYDPRKSIFGNSNITSNITCDAAAGKCAGYLENVYDDAGVDITASGITGDAWNLSYNIQAAGGSLLYNALDDRETLQYVSEFVNTAKDKLWSQNMDTYIDTPYGALPKSFVQAYGGRGHNALGKYGSADWYKKAVSGSVNTADLKRLLFKHNKKKEEALFNNLKVGDVVGAFVGGTKYGLRALLDPVLEGDTAGGKATFATHVGYVSGFDSDGHPIITHNINGHVAHEVLIPGDRKRQFFVTWAARPALRTKNNGGQPDFSTADRITEKIKADTELAADVVTSKESKEVTDEKKAYNKAVAGNFDGVYNGDPGDPYMYATMGDKYFFKKEGDSGWTEATHDSAIEAIGNLVAKKQVHGVESVVFEGEHGDPYLYKYEDNEFKFRKRGESEWKSAKDLRAVAAIRDVLMKGRRFTPKTSWSELINNK